MQVVPTVTELVLRQVGVSSCCCLGCSSSIHPEEGWFRSLGCLNGCRRSLKAIGALSSLKVRAMPALPSNPAANDDAGATRVQNKIQSAEQPGRTRWSTWASCLRHGVGGGFCPTLLVLRDTERRPPVLRDPIPEDILSTRPEVPLDWPRTTEVFVWPIRDDRGPLTTFVRVGGRHNRFLACASILPGLRFHVTC